MPNPAENSLNIKLNAPAPITSTIQIGNSLGQEMVNKTFFGQETSIDISQFPQVVYLVSIKDGNNSIVRKIVKK